MSEQVAKKPSVEERRKARAERQKAKEAQRETERKAFEAMIAEQMEDVADLVEAFEDAGEKVTVLTYKTDFGVVAVRQPRAVVMHRFRLEMNKTKKADLMTATDTLVVDCLIYPSQEAFQAIVQKLPLLPESIGTDLIAAAGGGQEALGKA